MAILLLLVYVENHARYYCTGGGLEEVGGSNPLPRASGPESSVAL